MRIVKVLILIVVMLLSGCGAWSKEQLMDVSSGKIGCSPSEIQISDHKVNATSETWVAKCEDKVYICSAVQTSSSSGEVSCTLKTH